MGHTKAVDDFQPPATDAYEQLTGRNPLPVNPWYFITPEQGEEVQTALIAAGVAPRASFIKEAASDVDFGNVHYGQDGRQVLSLNWSEINDSDPSAIFREPWSVQLGPLYWRWQEMKLANPSAAAQAGIKWIKTAGGSIVMR